MNYKLQHKIKLLQQSIKVLKGDPNDTVKQNEVESIAVVLKCICSDYIDYVKI